VPLSVHVAEHAPTPMQLWQQVQENVAATVAQIPAPVMDAMASALNQAPRCSAWACSRTTAWPRTCAGSCAMAWASAPSGARPGRNRGTLPRLDTHDLVVLFALHSTDPLLGEVAQAARTAGAKVLCITGSGQHRPGIRLAAALPHQRLQPQPGRAERHVPPVFDTTAASALIYSLTAHAVQWSNQPFELI
jgi:DNA-binding MurR/RpiR family transcriptional regulator